MQELKLSQLRKIEKEFGVYISSPVNVVRSINQQLGIFSMHDEHITDIVAQDRFFSGDELRQVLLLIGREACRIS